MISPLILHMNLRSQIMKVWSSFQILVKNKNYIWFTVYINWNNWLMMHVKVMIPSRNLDALSWCGQTSSYQPYLCKLGTPERTKAQKISYWKMVQTCGILQQKRHFCCLDLYNRGSKNKAWIIFTTFNYLWNMDI